MKKYKHIFFDLDRTLWDFEQNSTEAITELYEHFAESRRNIPLAEEFLEVYREKNQLLWAKYRKGEISKDELRRERFHQAFLNYEIDEPDIALDFNDRYIDLCSQKTHLMPYAKEVLEYLNNKYHLHIITNGFVEAQDLKMERSGIKDFFKAIIVSDGLGYVKPDERIFTYALEQAEAEVLESIMIGDDYESDILGAKKIGMDQVFLRPKKVQGKTATYEISELKELLDIL